MISDDIMYAINESTIEVDVIIMDKNTYMEIHREMMAKVYGNNPLSHFLQEHQPHGMRFYNIPVEISDKLKGFELI